jgi:hypothetical protein
MLSFILFLLALLPLPDPPRYSVPRPVGEPQQISKSPFSHREE